MKNLRLLLLSGVLLTLTSSVSAQMPGNLRERTIAFTGDTVVLDSLSLIPGSLLLQWNGTPVNAAAYYLNPAKGQFFVFRDSIAGLRTGDSLKVTYRVYPISFTTPRFIRDRNLLTRPSGKAGDPVYTEPAVPREGTLFGLEGLTRSGSISRGLTIGTNQDAVVNSSLNLQLAGRIGGNIDVLAAITDENIPVQAEGNTQQLQEFDRVFIQLSTDKHKLIAGDYDVRNPDGYFMRYFKKAQGGLYSYTEQLSLRNGRTGTISAGLGAAVSRGKFARNIINGIESNQGPYRLRGAENEQFIVIMSNSERVFIDGLLLERGQDRDYIIDYNTAELIFTTRRLINKDMRIIVEFQYADRNYARTLVTGFTSWKQDRLFAGINIYSEQDSKNQPLQQDLSPEDKLILKSAGDSLNQAFTPGGDSVAFNANEILYAQRDTLVNGVVYPKVYVYSTSPDSAFWRVSFSNVGTGRGNYVAVDGTANGRVYRWVAPVNGIPQGTYEPLLLLISPKQRQLVSAFVRYDITSRTKIGVELATSKDDVNRFATKDKANDDGFAARISFDHEQSLKKDQTGGWNYFLNLQTEVNDETFRPVEVYRAVEYGRDWNITGLDAFDKEWLSFISTGIRHPQKGEVRYGLRSLLRGGNYTGLMQVTSGQLRPGNFSAKWDASLLTTRGGIIESSFLRHRDEISYRWGSFIPGIRVEQERNAQRKPGTDTLAANAFHFRIAELFFTRPDTVAFQLKGSVSRREDDGLKADQFVHATTADMASFGAGWNKSARQKISIIGNYRNLKIVDSTYTTVRPEESVTGRIDYSLNTRKGFLTITAFYEGGTGREPRRVYSFVQVAPGTGNYSWNDYNDDGIPQLNEFEVALFSDQANYIRIFSTTDDYVKVFFNQSNAVLNLMPAALYAGSKKPLWSRFSLLSSVRFDNRIAGEGGWKVWNPLATAINDSALLSTQSTNRHTLFFDRSSSKLAVDLTYQDTRSKQLLASGQEARGNSAWIPTIRWNITRWLGLQEKLEFFNRRSEAETFVNRNYLINGTVNESKLNFQPGSTYRITLSWRYQLKENTLPEGLGEKARLNDGGVEWRYNSVKKGLISARFNVVAITYNAETNTPIAFEMLEGLKAGTNYTWGLNIQRNIGSGLQLSINYEGRRPAGLKTIHTGGAQVRAFF